MKREKKKYYEVSLKLPSSENILYIILIAAAVLIFIYMIKPIMVVPTRVKPIIRDYAPNYFSNFVSFFYSILVVNSAFKPIWLIFWPVLFYIVGKRFLKNKKNLKYYLAIIGFIFAYFFYAIPNHSLVALALMYKPAQFSINSTYPDICKEKNIMVFSPPDFYNPNSGENNEWLKSFDDNFLKYVGEPVYYMCVGNGTSVNITFTDWNKNKSYCSKDIKFVVSTKKYIEMLNQPRSLFPMFVFDCNYIVSPYLPVNDEKEWLDIFCFHSSFVTPRCFLHLMNPSIGTFLPPENFLY
jgi:hypothetical protein